MVQGKFAGVVLAGLMVTGVGGAVAQMGMRDMGMQMKEVPAPDKLPVPVKMVGIGNSYLAIKASPDAQAWFEQGLNLLHDLGLRIGEGV